MIRATHYGQRLMIALCLGLTVIAAGCGGRAGSQVDPLGSSDDSSYYQDDIYSNPSASPSADWSADPTPTPDVEPTPEPTPTPTPTPTPSPTPSPTPTPTATPTPPPTSGNTMTATIVKKDFPGFLTWEKCEITVQVHNPSFLRTQMGNLSITYTLKGQVVEKQVHPIVLNPAEIRHCGPYRSEKHADDATVTITP
ncbi:putative hemoglobin and hemoglobin-haptoglobin-binding protein 3 precursor [compost metagenome]